MGFLRHTLERAFNKYNARGYFKFISDELCIKMLYHLYFDKDINLDNPQTFNEKLQWLKLHDRKDIYSNMVDKYEAKLIVASKIGEEYIIPTLGIWNSFDEIEFDKLPDQFVLKCTHDSGNIFICENKDIFDYNIAKKKLSKGLKTNFFWAEREWPYKNVKPRIIAEKYMKDDKNGEICDYKIFCFNGVPKLILVCKDRFSKMGLSEDFFTDKWEHIDVRRPEHRIASEPINKPDNLEEMLNLAKILSKGVTFLRTDFYSINNNIYFGEMTFFPAGGFEPFEPKEYDSVFGQWLDIKK